MAPIRKGDGTPLEIPGVQEVRTGDGRVFFEGDVVLPGVVDNFQDADADPSGVYETGEGLTDYYRDAGGMSSLSRDGTRAAVGSQSITGDSSSSGTWIYSLEGDGLNKYPQKGDVFQFYYYNNDSDLRGFVGFGIDSDGAGYWARMDGSILIQKGTSSDMADSTLSSTFVSTPSDEWFVGEIEWHDGSGSESNNDIVFNLYDTDSNNQKNNLLGSTSANDSDFANETGVGWGFNNVGGNEGWMDGYEVIGQVSN